jgi:hypothetical protein
MAITVTKKKKKVSVEKPEASPTPEAAETPPEAPAAQGGALPASMASSAAPGHQTLGVAPPVFAAKQESYGGTVAMAIIAVLLFLGLLGLQYMEWEYLVPMFPDPQAAAVSAPAASAAPASSSATEPAETTEDEDAGPVDSSDDDAAPDADASSDVDDSL